MTHIIRSGAFLQQCWSVHPLCVTVARMEEGRTVVLSCRSCRSSHYVTAESVEIRESSAQAAGDRAPTETPGALLLATCATVHRASIALREMDVFQDVVVFRCADCRRHYVVRVSIFETHQK
ncbi:MAG: hypothetical protein NNA20_01935 [Nitrospira sp.]|nr:hypothetical protein [Nitrospira sp.]MCP9441331.1 hypothetical protein [Nitrospira sp.]